MKTFKYLVKFHSFWHKPDEFIVNTIEEVNQLKEEGINQQYKVSIEEGNFYIKNGYWFNSVINEYI